MKIILFLICLAIIFNLTGCGEISGSNTTRYQCQLVEIQNPKTSDDFVKVSRQHYSDGEYNCAYTAAEEALRLQKDNSKAMAARGLAELGLKDFLTALADFDLAIEFDSKNYEAYLGRSIVFEETKDLPQSITELSQAIEIAEKTAEDSFNVPVLLNRRGKLHQKNANQKLALKDFSEAIAQNPNYRFFYDDRAQLYREMGRLEEALADEEKASDLEANAQKITVRIKVKGTGLS